LICLVDPLACKSSDSCSYSILVYLSRDDRFFKEKPRKKKQFYCLCLVLWCMALGCFECFSGSLQIGVYDRRRNVSFSDALRNAFPTFAAGFAHYSSSGDTSFSLAFISVGARLHSQSLCSVAMLNLCSHSLCAVFMPSVTFYL
jgi:hypothetical protein